MQFFHFQLLSTFFIGFSFSQELLALDETINSQELISANTVAEPVPLCDQASSNDILSSGQKEVDIADVGNIKSRAEIIDQSRTASSKACPVYPSLGDDSNRAVDSSASHVRGPKLKPIRCRNKLDKMLCCRNPENITRRRKRENIRNDLSDISETNGEETRRIQINECVECT